MLQEFISHSPEETRSFGRKFAEGLQDNNVVAVYGELGAGKTQFIKGICSHFGVKDIISSPSFIIVNEYISDRNLKIFHFDFYRLKILDEIINIGFSEYLKAGGLVLIEWPDLVENILPGNTKKIFISHYGGDEHSRRIEIK